MKARKSSIDKLENTLNQKIVRLFDHIAERLKRKSPSVNQSRLVEYLTFDPASKNEYSAPSASDYFTSVRVKFNKPQTQDVLLLERCIKKNYADDIELLQDCRALLSLVAERNAANRALPDLTKKVRELETCLKKFWNGEGDLEKMRSEVVKRLDDIDFSNPAHNYSPILLLTIQRLEIPWHRHVQQKHNEAITISIGKKLADVPDDHVTEHGLKLLSIAGRAQYLLAANGKEGHMLQRMIELKQKLSIAYSNFPELLTTDTQFDDAHYVMNSNCPADVRLDAFERLSNIVEVARKITNASNNNYNLKYQGLCCIACYLANNDRVPEAEVNLKKLEILLNENLIMPEATRSSVLFYSSMVHLKILFDAKSSDYNKIDIIIKTASKAATAYLRCEGVTEPLDPVVLALHCYYRAAISPFVEQAELQIDALKKASDYLRFASMGGCIKSKAWIQEAVEFEMSKYPAQNY